MTLRYLATGDNIGTLSALYRIPRSTFSVFLPEVCEAIYNSGKFYNSKCKFNTLQYTRPKKICTIPFYIFAFCCNLLIYRKVEQIECSKHIG